MNKGDLVDAMAQDAGISKAQAQAALDSIVDNIKRSLRAGRKVSLVGFGTFASSRRSARTGRNPQTGSPIRIPAKNVAKFSAGKALKDAIN
jgi:DNA-binding protein HU-beta